MGHVGVCVVSALFWAIILTFNKFSSLLFVGLANKSYFCQRSYNFNSTIMRRYYFIVALLLMAAGVQNAFSQAGMLIWKDGELMSYHLENMDSIMFVDNVNRYIAGDYVDLGLPSGTLWATCNVGANSPEESGEAFAWGELVPKTDYTWENYKYSNGTSKSLTKYCTKSEYGDNYFTDDLLELLPGDDVATMSWGADWRMPSKLQFDELLDESYTTAERATLNGVKGRKITSKSNGNSIFLPVTTVTSIGTGPVRFMIIYPMQHSQRAITRRNLFRFM